MSIAKSAKRWIGEWKRDGGGAADGLDPGLGAEGSWSGLEALESRLLLAADLVGVFSDNFNPVGPQVPGDVIDIPVIISNVGDLAAQGRLELRLFASQDLEIDDSDVLVMELTELELDLEPQQSQTFNFEGLVPLIGELPPLPVDPDGLLVPYNLLVEIFPRPKRLDEDLRNNEVKQNESGRRVTLNLSWEFGNVDGRRGRTKLITENDDELNSDFGEVTTFQLTGAGSGELQFNEATGLFDVVLYDTDKTTKVKLAVKGGDGRVEIGDIIAADLVGRFDGKAIDLRGDARFTGGIEKLTLGSVTGDQMIEIGGSAESKPVSIVIGSAQDLSINSVIPIKSLTLTELIETTGSPSTISAPSIAKLKVKGDKKQGLDGDFQANLNLDGTDNAKKTLASAKIAGDIDRGVWTITGDSGKVQVKGLLDNWTLNVENRDGLRSTLDGLKLTVVEDASVFVDGNVKSITAVDWQDGQITADTLKTIKIKGDKRNEIAGDLDIDMTLSGTNNPKVKKTLGSARVAGGVEAVAWHLTGDSGKVDIKGQVNDWSLTVNSDLDKLKLGQVIDADVSVDDHLKAVEAIRWDSGTLEADTIGSLKTKGDKRNAIAGDFGADLMLTGPQLESKIKQALGKAVINGQWDGVAQILGDAGSLKAQAFAVSLTIDGDAKKIQVVDDFLILLDPGVAGSGNINITGEAKVKGKGDSFDLTGAQLFTSPSDELYVLEDLFELDQVGRVFSYDVRGSGVFGFGGLSDVEFVGGSGTTSLDRVVHAQVNPDEFEVRDTVDIDGDMATVVSDWSFTDAGGFLNRLGEETFVPGFGSGEVYVVFNDLQVAPTKLRLGEKHADTSQVRVDIRLGTLEATLTGSAEVTSQFKGHKQVQIPAGTFTAAEVIYKIAFEASGILSVQGTDIEMTLKISQQSKSLAAPGLGIVHETVTSRGSAKAKIPGEGTASGSGSGRLILELVDVT